jgi:hypothetical protein
MARLHSCIRPSHSTHPGFSGKNANQNYQTHGHQGKQKSRWRVLTGSPETQQKKLKAKYRKNNFKKMVRSPNSSNSDKNDESGCCK